MINHQGVALCEKGLSPFNVSPATPLSRACNTEIMITAGSTRTLHLEMHGAPLNSIHGRCPLVCQHVKVHGGWTLPKIQGNPTFKDFKGPFAQFVATIWHVLWWLTVCWTLKRMSLVVRDARDAAKNLRWPSFHHITATSDSKPTPPQAITPRTKQRFFAM